MKERSMDTNPSLSQDLKKSYWLWVQKPPTSSPRKRTGQREQELQNGPPVSRAQGPDRGQSTNRSSRLQMCPEKVLNCLLSVSPGWKNMWLRIRTQAKLDLLLLQCLCHHLGFTHQTCLVGSKLSLKTLTCVLNFHKISRRNK